MGTGDKEAKVKWLLNAELEQPDSKPIVPRRHCHTALGSFVSVSPESRHSPWLCQCDGQACPWLSVAILWSLSGAW